jgi:cytidine deaminase
MTLNDELLRQLVEAANAARRWAYTPYSRYAVGAALLTTSGKIYDGVNVENASFPNTVCAERVVVFKAVSEGERSFQALAVVTRNGGSPCGACRQVLAEFGQDTLVIIADESGNIHRQIIVADLLPGAFMRQDLLGE